MSSGLWHPVPAGSGCRAAQMFSACFPGLWIHFSLVRVQEGGLHGIFRVSSYQSTTVSHKSDVPVSRSRLSPQTRVHQTQTKSVDLNISETLAFIQKEDFPRPRRITFTINIRVTILLQTYVQPPVYVGSYCSHSGGDGEHRTCSSISYSS